MREKSLRRYQNRSIEVAQIVEELIVLARHMREALGLTEDKIAFYDALETNDSALKVLGGEILRTIARELVSTVRSKLLLTGLLV